MEEKCTNKEIAKIELFNNNSRSFITNFTSMKTALITGASSGIGKEFVTIFAQNGYNLVLAARNKEALQEISKATEDKFNNKIEVVAIDLSVKESPQKLYDLMHEKDIQIDVLVNNAGFGEHGNVIETTPSRLTNMIDLNVTTLTELTTLFVTEMTKRDSGKILNIASTAAFQPIPKMAVYAATKAYVLNFTEALHFELRKTNVTVSTLCPGATKTGFEKNANFNTSNLFKGAMDAKTVAEIGYKGLMKGKMTIVSGGKNKVMSFFSNVMPSRKMPLIIASKMIG